MSHDIPAMRELLVLAASSLAVVMLFQRLRLPATVGFIVTGVMIGPQALGLVKDPALVRTLAEIGVALLLFMVGLEFSLTDLRRLGRTAIVAGALQSLLTLVVVTSLLVAMGNHPARALGFGMLLTMSSTALVLAQLADRLELTSPHGRLATGVLIFQDLLVVPFAIAVPHLGRWFAGETGASASPEVGRSLGLVALVAIMFAGGHRIFPWLLGRASRVRSRQAFLLGVVLVALGSATLTAWAGLSFALGAFLAGLILAESELRSQVAADVLPFRDALSSVFFVSIGMLFDPRVLLSQPLLVLASTVGLVAIKALVALLALRLAGVPWRVAVAAGLAIAQVGEFSFVLAQAATPSGLLGPVGGQAFLAGAVFSLMLTPLLVAKAPEWALALELRLALRGMDVGSSGAEDPAPQSKLLSDHVVIAGAGLNGRNTARVLRSVRVQHVIVDLDPESLQVPALEGSPAMVGDITNPLILKRAGVPRARVLVLALSDPTATRHACQTARALSRDVFIIVRTRYVTEIDELHRLGANQIIPEEFETSIEIFTAVLRCFHVPMNVIQAQITLLRQERYSLLRGIKLPRSVVDQLDAILQQGTADTFTLLQESPAVGRTLGELGVRLDDQPGDTQPGARLVAVVRGGHALSQLSDDFRLQVGDTLVLAGTHAEMERTFDQLSPAAPTF